ncbi:ATP-dependent RNA helicase dbp9 [Auriculariales sp. MPI-PUGE-AT-0066]|nr:ATP-dependent RNA helicase dbp9 [Auriculariales sp. MPI-PUGE-AT-0066]
MADSSKSDEPTSFVSLSSVLDARLLRALADLGFARPTLVQAKAIPLALEGRDILARARTGSGKTAAYCIPVVQKILSAKSLGKQAERTTRALMLVPTRELSEQVSALLKQLLVYCDRDVTFANAASGSNLHIKAELADQPDIVIVTPAKALALLQAKTLIASSVESLVIDEADLILSYGHDDDMKAILAGGFLPSVFQSYLMSATMTKDVETLKGLVLRSPAILRLEEDEDAAANLSQYSVRCTEVDKFLLTYVMLKLKLVKGKCLIFVNDVDRSYRLKLFLEQFSIKSCVLNSELPLNSRFHIVQEFNRGVYDYIIATDESGGKGEADSEVEEGEKEEQAESAEEQSDEEMMPTQRSATKSTTPAPKKKSLKRKRASPPPPPAPAAGKKRPKKGDAGYGVSRGVDFVDVACVLNFDLPTSARAYIHRVGRTARAGRSGMALSFIIPTDEFGKNRVVGGVESTKHDEKVWARVEADQAARGSKVVAYVFDMAQVNSFRYRMEDALRAVTRAAVKEARVKELKSEILASEKLKAHFEDNPLDLEFLRHDKRCIRPACRHT